MKSTIDNQQWFSRLQCIAIMTREALLTFIRSERYAIQASVSKGLIHVRVSPVWIRYSNFNAQPPEIVEFDADALR